MELYRWFSLFVFLFKLFEMECCPDPCRCYSNKIVDCSSASLKSVPANIPNDTLELDFSNNELTLSDFDFGHLPKLKKLNLNGNKITHYNHYLEGDLQDLQYLSLENNGLVMFYHRYFEPCDLCKLEHLFLSNNSLRGDKLLFQLAFPQLSRLSLSDNPMSSIRIDAFLDVPKLKELDMKNTLINCTCEFIAMIKSYKDAADVTCNHNGSEVNSMSKELEDELCSFCPSEWCNCFSDNYTVDCSNVDFDYNPPRIIKIPENTEVLDMSNSDLSFKWLDSGLDNLLQLQTLKLSNGDRIFLFERTLKNCRNLMHLFLDNTGIDWVNPQAFENNGKLQTLDLSNNNFTSSYWVDNLFEPLTNLRDLRFKRNGIDCECSFISYMQKVQNKTFEVHMEVDCKNDDGKYIDAMNGLVKEEACPTVKPSSASALQKAETTNLLWIIMLLLPVLKPLATIFEH